jgi:hypothetical protein
MLRVSGSVSKKGLKAMEPSAVELGLIAGSWQQRVLERRR